MILTGTNLVGSAYHWNLDFLTSQLGSGQNTVYSSKTGKFKYFDEKKIPQNKDFHPPTSHTEMTFQEFRHKLETEKNERERYVTVFFVTNYDLRLNKILLENCVIIEGENHI